LKAGHAVDPSAYGFSATIYAAAAGILRVNRKASLHNLFFLLEVHHKEVHKRTNHKTGDIQNCTITMLKSPYDAKEG
jgi:hypothetical protein